MQAWCPQSSGYLAARDFSEFKEVVFTVARLAGYEVAQWQDSPGIPNFFAAKLESREGPLHLLCTLDGEWAFASSLTPGIEFADSKTVGGLLESFFDVRALSREYLTSDFSPRDGMHQSAIKYWKPETMGDAIFNWRD